jgi:peroxiredoxin
LIVLVPFAALALEIGSAPSHFSGLTVDGRHFSLNEAEKSHRAVVVLFLSTICPYSNYYNDLLKAMSAEFGAKGVLFLGVNTGRLESVAEVTAHAREHGLAFPFMKDSDARVADIFGARQTPEVFVLDSSGVLVYRGRIASKLSSPDLKNALDSLLAGRPIRPARTKAFGCAIARN